MARLYQRGKVYYSDIFYQGHPQAGKDGRLRIPLDTDKDEAQRKLTALIDNRDAEKHGHAPKKSTWENFKLKLNNFLQRRAMITQFSYKRSVKLLEKFRPVKELHQITPALLDELYVHWKVVEKRPLYVRNKDIKCLKSMMSKAEAWGYLSKPLEWDTVKPDEEPRGRVHFWEIDEVKEILKECSGIWKTSCWIGTRAGLRLSEKLWLHRKDVDFKQGKIHVDSKPQFGWTVKNYERRSVPMTPDLQEHLEMTLRDGREWVLQEDKWRPTWGSLSAYFSRIVKRCGLKGTDHTCRHTFASHLALAGRELIEIRDLMGHKSIKSTEIYSHLRPITGKNAIGSLPVLKF